MGSNDGGSGPEWATGLKRLYDQVVDEPIPDSFMDLLSKLDDTSR
ncbi:NepR family anti-sigma factor [Croceibacterium mercuriale]|nr:NepR family anti-sigma factor [Croceibacterium mercuriale]